MKTTIQAALTPELLTRSKAFADEGWAGDFDELLAEALGRYLESHSSDLTEKFLRERAMDFQSIASANCSKRPCP